MIHNVISSRNADYSFYVKCDCGKELIHFVYFGESVACDEIIAIKYYGPDSTSHDAFTFTQSNLRKLSDHLKLSLSESIYTFSLEDATTMLQVTKDISGFYTIKRKHYAVKMIEDWEICLRDFSIKLIVDELDKMYDIINITREQKKIKLLERIELEKKASEERRKKNLKNK